MQAIKILDAVEETGNSDGIPITISSDTSVGSEDDALGTKYTFYLVLGGTVASLSMTIQVSQDGTNFSTIKTITATTALQLINDIDPIKIHSMRANVATLTGTQPTVTLWVVY